MKHIINHQKWRTHHEIKRHTREAFEDAKRFVDSFYGANDKNPKLVILDSGCGVGMSTYMLGRQFPDMPIIGIDRSEKRLSRRLRLDGEEFLKGGKLGPHFTLSRTIYTFIIFLTLHFILHLRKVEY